MKDKIIYYLILVTFVILLIIGTFFHAELNELLFGCATLIGKVNISLLCPVEPCPPRPDIYLTEKLF